AAGDGPRRLRPQRAEQPRPRQRQRRERQRGGRAVVPGGRAGQLAAGRRCLGYRRLTPMPRRCFAALALSLCLGGPWAGAGQDTPPGPGDVAALQRPPKVTWVDESGPLRKLYYESALFQGKPTRVFAYLALPKKVEGKAPAMVLVHGGGGKAFPQWAKLWA